MSTVFYFSLGTFGEQLSPPLSAVVKFQSQENSLVHVFGSRSVVGAGWGSQWNW